MFRAVMSVRFESRACRVDMESVKKAILVSGAYIRFTNGSNISLSTPGGKLCTNFRAEALAITTAADFLNSCDRPLTKVAFFTDSMSALQALDSNVTDITVRNMQSPWPL